MIGIHSVDWFNSFWHCEYQYSIDTIARQVKAIVRRSNQREFKIKHGQLFFIMVSGAEMLLVSVVYCLQKVIVLKNVFLRFSRQQHSSTQGGVLRWFLDKKLVEKAPELT